MNHLPLETLQQIFELACTDGGYTGCSLALTSKSIREAAQSTRFHSVMLVAETERLVALIALYQNQCSNSAGIRPRTAHLHLLLRSTVNTRQSTDSTEEVEWDEESEDEDLEESTFPLVQQFLSLVSNDLQSLVVIRDTLGAATPLFDRAFPSLRDLTLAFQCNITTPDPTVVPIFPALTHLHIVAPNWSPPLFPRWIAQAPRVTHLRISAHCLFGKFVDELPAAVGTPEYPFKRGFRGGITVGPPPAVRTYPTLARVVVAPGPRPASGPCGSNRYVFNSRTMQLDWIAARARESGVEMYVAPPCAWAGDEWDEAIRTEWLKRIGGEASRDWFRGADEPEDGSDEGEGEDDAE
ncbi:hypothetical protein V8D89_011207 [Ganoderma adspersum]